MPKHAFSSDSFPSELPARVRAKLWADSMRTIGASFDMGIITSREFHGEVAVLMVGEVHIGAAKTVADGQVRVIRSSELCATDNDDRIMIVINRGDTAMSVQQVDREVLLRRDEMTVVSMDVPSVCTTPSGGASNVVMVPRELIEHAGKVIERHAATRLLNSPLSQRLLSSLVRDLLAVDDIDQAGEGVASETVVRLISTILRLPELSAPVTVGKEGVGRIAEVRRAIAKSYKLVDLTPNGVGKPLGLSARSIQHLLKQHGTTFSAEVSSLRLEAAHRMLKSASKESIAEIAFKCGFADLSTFNRAFRARYGAPPRAFLVRKKISQ